MNIKNFFKSNQIYYYFSNYRTTVGNTKYTSKGNIKKIQKIKARIKSIFRTKPLITLWDFKVHKKLINII